MRLICSGFRVQGKDGAEDDREGQRHACVSVIVTTSSVNDVSFRFAAVWRAFGHPVFYAAPARPHDTPFFGPTT